jgi:PRC-barrel domain protein
MPRPSIETARGWRQKPTVDREGVLLGRIVHIYLDQHTGEPEWALLSSGPEDRLVFVPLVDAAEQEDQIGVPVDRALVSAAPAIRPGRRLSKEATARLHGHYGGAPELRFGSARRMPGGGPPARLRQGLDRARERVPSPTAAGSPRTRRLLAAGAAAASSVTGGLLVVRRRRRERPSGLAGAIGRAVGSILAVATVALGRRRRQRRLRALAGTAAAPFAAAGRAVARGGRRVPVPTRTLQPRTPRNRRTRMAGNLKLLAGLAAGYVLGARAGRERYERIAQGTRRLAERPEVRELIGNVRSGLGAGLEKAIDRASDRLQQARGEERASQDRADLGRPATTRRPAQGTGQAPLAEAGPAAGEDHGGTGSPQSEPGEADARGRDDSGSSPEEPVPSRARRERSRSGRER